PSDPTAPTSMPATEIRYPGSAVVFSQPGPCYHEPLELQPLRRCYKPRRVANHSRAAQLSPMRGCSRRVSCSRDWRKKQLQRNAAPSSATSKNTQWRLSSCQDPCNRDRVRKQLADKPRLRVIPRSSATHSLNR